MLAKQQELYKAGGKHLSRFDMANLFTPLKNDGEHSWLFEVSNASLQRVCSDLNEAYQGFFQKRAGFPKFKSKKRSKPSFPVRSERLWFDNNGFVHITKLGKVKFKTDFDLPIGTGQKFANPRVAFVNGKWILSFGIECENQTFKLNDYSMGIDLGIKDSAIVA